MKSLDIVKPGLLIVSLFLLNISCKNKSTLFNLVSAEHSGILFNNQIVENDSINPIDMTNIYNGGGVGIGDFNNDGLQDIYFTGNLVPNKLYLNKGKLIFEDITDKAGVEGKGRWSRGVTIVDVNNDGLQDIYVSVTMENDPVKRQNLFYINQGVDKDGIPQFRDMAAEYGLNDTAHATNAAFFDYDNDGDLDMYLVVNEILNSDNPSVFRKKFLDGSHFSNDRLYRNDWDSLQNHPVFTDVSAEAGVVIEGYGHAVSISDFNKDGYKDIFVTNDFISNDILYINNRDGTFTDKASSYFKHTSANGMGQDVIDINNDGLNDVIELDMNPEDNYRKKMMMGANSYLLYQNSDFFNYQYQYVRNTLQLNQGPTLSQGDSIGDPIFSDVAYFSGIAETDWSWTPLVADFDNDGFRDIIITNGFPKDITDHDFIAFRKESYSIASKDFTLAQIPQVKIHNYAFKNNGDVTFSNTTFEWGMQHSSFSNGAAYADLDNDGDMDVVINNINDKASLYENTTSHNTNDGHYLRVRLKGDSLNRDGLGAWVELHYDGGRQQVYELTPYRGYLSTVQKDPQFGLGKTAIVDTIIIKWPNGKQQLLRNVRSDELLTVDIADAKQKYSWQHSSTSAQTLFDEVTDSLHITYANYQKDFIDFNLQKLLPHKFTEYGPALATGDVNGDGTDDIIIGGNTQQGATIFFQQQSGEFIRDTIPTPVNTTQYQSLDMGVSLFDADNDGDLDLYIAKGGYEAAEGSEVYRDKFYLNNGKGKFIVDTLAIPQNLTSKSCVRVADFDRDGDLDLFIAGRVDSWKYPQPVSCFIYRNDTHNGIVNFTDITNSVAPFLKNIGMVCDAVWADFDNDGWTDLLLAGEWMPLTFIKNNSGQFSNVTSSSGIADHLGWWNSIVPGDFDNDGDLDFIAGNLGLNSFYKASQKYPVKIYANDFDNNGSYDAIPTIYLPTSQSDTSRKEYPAHVRDDMIKQMIGTRAKFQDYKSYASVPFSQMFKAKELNDALTLEANDFHNSFIKNEGNGKFTISALPSVAQYSCLNGMLAEDFDGDGQLDLLATGNDYGTEVSVGRYDACNGIYFKGNGSGGFTSLSISESGWFIPGNGKALIKYKNPRGETMILASQNRSEVKAYRLSTNTRALPVLPLEVTAKIFLKNGQSRIINIDYGSSFLSQSGRFLTLDQNVSKVVISDSRGEIRTITF